MELPDEVKDLLEATEDTAGGGKDLLYGWLVGRAAADLGLAQALALSQAQHSDKIKRLEESLLEQIRELQKFAAPTDARASVEVAALKAELQRVSDNQRQLAADRVDIAQLEALIGGKLHEFEAQRQRQPQSNASSDLDDITFELKLLADRIARTEYSVQQAQIQAEQQSHRIGEIITDRVKTESTQLKTQLSAELLGNIPSAPMDQSLEANLKQQLDDLRAELEPAARAVAAFGGLQNDLVNLSQRLGQIESTASLADHEQRFSQELDACMTRLEQASLVGTAEIRADIDRMASRLDEASTALACADLRVKQLEESASLRIGELQKKVTDALGALERRDVEMSNLHGQMDRVSSQLSELSQHWEQYAAQTRELETLLGEKSAAEERSGADLAPLQLNVSALLQRMTELELSFQQARASSAAEAQQAQQVAAVLGTELAALKAELGKQTTLAKPMILANIEETFGAKIDELESRLTGALQADQGRHMRLHELQDEIHAIAGRLLQAESTSQQTHALVLQEAQQAEQLRDGVCNELAELRGQLVENSAGEGRSEGWGEALNARIDDLQSQLSRSIAALEGRDMEIAALKSQIQQLVQNAGVKPAQPAPPVHRFHPPFGVTGGLNAEKAPSEVFVQPVSAAPGELHSLLRSFDAEADGSKEQKRQLQQRISADIERVRAELRKRTGVSR